jgi:hypothetical protein
MSTRPFRIAVLALAMAPWLTSCADMKAIGALLSADGPPAFTYESQKAPRVVVDCLLAKWNGARIMGATPVTQVMPTATGFRVSLVFDDTLDQELLTEAKDAGSTTLLWTKGKRYGDKLPQVRDVEACQ